MDNRPIGILDSGVGGLTVVGKLLEKLPKEEIIYIGDSKRAPYGTRPENEIKSFTWQMVNFLLEKNVKMIVFACNTATAIALDEIKQEVKIPLVGVIVPGVSAAVERIEKNPDAQVGVIGTPATITSEIYPTKIHSKLPKEAVFSLACPSFVPLVENNQIASSQDEVTRTLAPLMGQVGVLILGCTHYPLLSAQISKAVGPAVVLVDSGAETVNHVAVLLDYFSLYREGEEKSPVKHQFYTTGQIDKFREIARQWLGIQDLSIRKAHIDA